MSVTSLNKVSQLINH